MFTISVKQNDKLVCQTGEGIVFTSGGGTATFRQSMDMLAVGIANILSALKAQAQGHSTEVNGGTNIWKTTKKLVNRVVLRCHLHFVGHTV